MTPLTDLDHNAALIVIDVQQGMDHPIWGERNNPDAEANIARLLAAWRAADRPVFHVQHFSTEEKSPLRPGQPGVAFKPEAAPQTDEPVLTKHVNSAFIGTDLERRLRADSIEQIVMVGLTTPHCVSTSARMAGNLGFTVLLVKDATAAFALAGPDGVTYPAQLVHDVALAELHDEFVTVVDTSLTLRLAAQR